MLTASDVPWDAADAATPIIRLAVDTMASSDPSTAARNQLARPLRWLSPCDGNDRRFTPRFMMRDILRMRSMRKSSASAPIGATPPRY